MEMCTTKCQLLGLLQFVLVYARRGDLVLDSWLRLCGARKDHTAHE